MTLSSRPAVAVVVLLLACCLHFTSAKEFVRVRASGEACFHENLRENEPLTVVYQVVRGGYMDIDLKILSPTNEPLLSQERKTEDRVSITAKTAGRHVICFGNAMSTVTPKDLHVGIHAGRGALLDDQVAEQAHLKPVHEKVCTRPLYVSRVVHRELATIGLKHTYMVPVFGDPPTRLKCEYIYLCMCRHFVSKRSFAKGTMFVLTRT
jgi:hypothetical protein